MLQRLGAVAVVIIATIPACSPELPPSAAILEDGIPLIEYKRCDGLRSVRQVRVYVDEGSEGKVVWRATLRAGEVGTNRIPYASDVPGYEISASPDAFRPDQRLFADAHDTRGPWIGGPTFRLDELRESRALTSLDSDGTTSYMPAERWRSDLSDCRDRVWPAMLMLSLGSIALLVIMISVDRRRRRPIITLPVPPPPLGPFP